MSIHFLTMVIVRLLITQQHNDFLPVDCCPIADFFKTLHQCYIDFMSVSNIKRFNGGHRRKIKMKINIETIEKTCPEAEIFESVLSLNHQTILELGCGDATLTRLVATTGEGRKITATEVDKIQHEKNILINDLSNVNFKLAGSENIPISDSSFDTVFMFKSFHHVPVNLMSQALQEVKRVLKEGGFAYISEPVFAGDFNEILRLFHDEEAVRKSAFKTLVKAVAAKQFLLESELFFNTPLSFENFEQFAERVIGATHSEHQLTDELYSKVKQQYNCAHASNDGNFLIPLRVDILKKI